jgi:hypothetical protein
MALKSNQIKLYQNTVELKDVTKFGNMYIYLLPLLTYFELQSFEPLTYECKSLPS